MGEQRVTVTGLRDLSKAFKALDTDAVDAMKAALKAIAEGVAADVRSRVPRRSGRMAGSYVPRGSVKGASIAFAGTRAPYAPWIEFGGSVGKARSVRRPVVKGGRYLYPAIDDNMADVEQKVADAISDLTSKYGFRVD